MINFLFGAVTMFLILFVLGACKLAKEGYFKEKCKHESWHYSKDGKKVICDKCGVERDFPERGYDG